MKLLFWRKDKTKEELIKSLEIENIELKSELKHIKDLHLLELRIKNQEIDSLNEKLNYYINNSFKEKNNTEEENLKQGVLSRLEREVLTKHHNNQCKSYDELQKITNKNKESLRNIVMKIKKKNYKFEWYI